MSNIKQKEIEALRAEAKEAEIKAKLKREEYNYAVSQNNDMSSSVQNQKNELSIPKECNYILSRPTKEVIVYAKISKKIKDKKEKILLF